MSKSTTTLAAAITLALAATAAPVMAQDSDEERANPLMEEVVVTARKMEESLQDVPVAVSAVSAQMIEDLQINSLEDISKITAGLVFDSEFQRGANRPVIRGQGNIQGSSGVSYFIDGVYITGSIDDYDLNDVERVEVVKGPQSALYGRNTYSGAINIITKSPGDSPATRFKFEAASDEQYEGSVSWRGPIAENWGAGLTARYYALDAPFTNELDGTDIGTQESKSLSGVLEWTPSDRLSARFRMYWSDTDDGQPPVVAQPASENNCFFDNGSLYRGNGRYYCGVVEPRPILSDWRFQAPRAVNSIDTTQLSLVLDYQLSDRWSITSITGYNERDETFIIEADYSPESFQTAVFARFPIAGFPAPPFTYGYVGAIVDFTFALQDDVSDISQELRFAYDGDRFDAMIGYYYFDQSSDNRNIRELPGGASDAATASYTQRLIQEQGICAVNPICEGFAVPLFTDEIFVPRDQNNFDIKNTAIFGMMDFDLTDSLHLTLEARYAEEEIEQTAIVRDLGYPAEPPVFSSATFTSFSPRATLDWQYSDNSMLYLLYAEGQKPGGFNSTVAIEAGLPTYDEEEIDSWELGWKNVWFDGQMVANFAFFMNDITGYQLTQNARSGANTTSAIVNAGDADVDGFEAEIRWAPRAVDGLTLTLNWAETDPTFTRGTDENLGQLLDVADDGLINCSTGDEFPDSPGCTSKFGSIVGNQIPRSSETQYFFDADYRFDMGGGEFFMGANYAHEDSKYAQVLNLAETGDADLVNARIGWQNDNYSVTLWGRNLTGEDSTPNVLRYADANADFQRNFAVRPRRDTYYGVTFIANF